ncbi:hypothetical protein PSQ19_06220 [Devosia algicola]|uniref:Uncharacterized protein n=1 Tax=Devosia algicola TaxID=3026418 RepID=A0ABY7YQR1_9HYPH|nr:hypothetical protein [Devosia algicola]WDR03663.1 hypothetical protein PSQ19_06220 [Devosia algicola]
MNQLPHSFRRHLVIMIGDRPHAVRFTIGDVIAWLKEQPSDDAAETRVWRCYGPGSPLEPSTDATARVASDWAIQVNAETRPGLRPNYPAFVLVHMGQRLEAAHG